MLENERYWALSFEVESFSANGAAPLPSVTALARPVVQGLVGWGPDIVTSLFPFAPDPRHTQALGTPEANRSVVLPGGVTGKPDKPPCLHNRLLAGDTLRKT